jgi:hypothetical protein
MSTAPHTSLRTWALPRPRMLYALFGLAACGALVATYSLATLARTTDGQARPAAHAKPTAPVATKDPSAAEAAAGTADAPPSAAEFAEGLVGAANAFSVEQGRAVRLSRAHCVQASPGHYMCSYETREPGRAPQCHIIQAQWTPDGVSTFTVTLSSRANRCESLRAALRSLK